MFIGRTYPGMANSALGVCQQHGLRQLSLPHPVRHIEGLSQLPARAARTDEIRRRFGPSISDHGCGLTHRIGRYSPGIGHFPVDSFGVSPADVIIEPGGAS